MADVKDPRGTIGAGCGIGTGLGLLIVAVVVCSLLAPIVRVIEDLTGVQRANAGAREAEEKSGLVVSEAQAWVMVELGKAGVRSIDSDRRAAHPIEWLLESLFRIGAILGAVFVSVMIFLTAVWWKDPEEASAILRSLRRVKERR